MADVGNACHPARRVLPDEVVAASGRGLDTAGVDRLGLREPDRCDHTIAYGRDKGKRVQELWYWCPVLQPSESAALCFATMFEVYGILPAMWLWITDIYEPDEWPEPLSKPKLWPPH
jgi:hypothetical protein